MTKLEDLKTAEKIFIDPKGQFLERVKALHKIQEILKSCGINPQARTPEILYSRIVQTKEILNSREKRKQELEKISSKKKGKQSGHKFVSKYLKRGKK